MMPWWKGIRPFLRHSLVLMVAGFVFVAIGISYIAADPSPSRLEGLKYLLKVMDYNHWGYVFVFAGVVSIISSRWPPVSETWGYMVLTGLSGGWSAAYFAGVVFGGAAMSGLSAVLSWGLIAFLWYAISGLVNPQALAKLAAQISALQAENLALHREIERLNRKLNKE